MALPSASLSRLRTAAAFYGRGLLRLFKDRMVLISAQAVAFKVLVTIVPVLILATGIFALILQQDRPFQALASLIADLLPGAYSGQLIDFLRELQGAGDAFTAIGAVGLLYSAITLFTTLRLVIQGVFREDWHEHRSMVRGYFFDLRMALA
ncbi:MAG: YhjD/YihY/BrkB family envelope integrity protein, partial [Bacteroidota bacterium]